MNNKKKGKTPDTVLVVESEVLVRTAIAGYLRDCGYRAIEAACADEAITVLNHTAIPIHILFSAAEMAGGMDGFSLAQWVRAHRPGVRVILAANETKAAKAAGELCEEGPHLRKPYEPDQVIAWIKLLKAKRK